MVQKYLLMLLIALFFALTLCEKEQMNNSCKKTENRGTLCQNQRYEKLCANDILKRLYQGHNYIELLQEQPVSFYYQVPKPDSYMFSIKICADGLIMQRIRISVFKEMSVFPEQPNPFFGLIQLKKDNQDWINNIDCQVYLPQDIPSFYHNQDCSTQLLKITLEKPSSWWLTNQKLGIRVYFQIYDVDTIKNAIAGAGYMIICLIGLCCIFIALSIFKLIQSIVKAKQDQENKKYYRMQPEITLKPAKSLYWTQNIPMGIQMSQIRATDSNSQTGNAQYRSRLTSEQRSNKHIQPSQRPLIKKMETDSESIGKSIQKIWVRKKNLDLQKKPTNPPNVSVGKEQGKPEASSGKELQARQQKQV